MQTQASYHLPDYIPKNLIFDFDIYHDPRVTSDVHNTYETLHRDAPDVFYTPRNGGHWMIMRYDLITEVVRDPEHFSAKEMSIPRVPNPVPMIPLNLDPPVSIPYRQALMPYFAPKTVAAMEGKVREWAIKIIDKVVAKGECDFVQDVSALFPVSIFMELMGLPLERLYELRALADEFFEARSQESINTCAAKIYGLLGEQLELKKTAPKQDLISYLISVDVSGRKLSTDEILNMCFVIFLGGMDTVTNVAAFSFREFAKDAALQKRIAGDLSLVPKFVDESLRCFGVVNTPRIVAKDIDKFGAPFRVGDMVLNCLPMAGRDERKNADPNKFDIDRKNPEILIFSTGPHLCIGSLLARLELRVLTEEWLKRIPSFTLKPNVEYAVRLGTVMGIMNLPLQWDK